MKEYEEMSQMEQSSILCVWSLVGIVVSMILMVFLLGSCSPKVVTVPEYHTEYVVRTDTFIQRDSIHTKDSILIHQKGDTVYCDRWHTLYQDRWRDRVRVDSFIKTDSIRVPYPVEKKLTRWQQVKIDLGGWMVGIIIASAVAFMVYLFRRKIL